MSIESAQSYEELQWELKQREQSSQRALDSYWREVFNPTIQRDIANDPLGEENKLRPRPRAERPGPEDELAPKDRLL